jgi:7,8-dihydropterin-6-yl-methyl-4-(beta-D-ribofuranosyl)aminobenzene 5'-phosphate synthase
MRMRPARFLAAACLLLALAPPAIAQDPKRITILYDAFGAPSTLIRDWGFAAFVEYGGRRILFDTGNNAKTFAHNVEALGVDLTKLDAVVISHRHSDHTSGLAHLLAVNPSVQIYVPHEVAFFGGAVPPRFLAPQPSLPVELRYFGGKPPAPVVLGTPWGQANFELVEETTEILPGFFVVITPSEKPGTVEMNELSLAIRTPKGLSVIVGCSHPGVEKILAQAAKIEPRLHDVTGGFHLGPNTRDEIQRLAAVLDDSLKVERVAPGHCTSELGQAVFLERFGERFDRAGVGRVITLP